MWNALHFSRKQRKQRKHIAATSTMGEIENPTTVARLVAVLHSLSKKQKRKVQQKETSATKKRRLPAKSCLSVPCLPALPGISERRNWGWRRGGVMNETNIGGSDVTIFCLKMQGVLSPNPLDDELNSWVLNPKKWGL